MHSFSSERLFIRPLAEEDKELYCSLYTDAKTMRYIVEPFSQKKAEKAFAISVKKNKQDDPNFYTWTVINKTNEKKIGITSLYKMLGKEILEHHEVGIMLLPLYTGKALGKESLKATIGFGFQNLRMSQINIRFNKSNIAIKELSLNLGFVDHNIYKFTDKHSQLSLLNNDFYNYLTLSLLNYSKT